MPDDLTAIRTQLAHLESLLREFDDQHSVRNQALHARLGDLEDLILGQRAQSFRGHADVRVLGRVPLILVRDDPA